MQQRASLGIGGIDATKMRKEVIRIQAMSDEERKQREFETEYQLYELQAEFDGYAIDIIKQLRKSNNPKDDFGRSAMPKVISTIAVYLRDKQAHKLNREKFEWAKQVYDDKKMGDFIDDLAKGVSIDIQVTKDGEDGGRAIEGGSPQAES